MNSTALLNELDYQPLFSVILPVYNTEEKWLRKCIDSVLKQSYPYWELCIADDASTKPYIQKVLHEYEEEDSRVKVVYREKNGHISAATNSALNIAKGEFIALLDHDDEIEPDALYENALLLNKYSDADMIYSDEDKIGVDGSRSQAFLKPDWSPDTLLSQMYTCHLGVYRTNLVKKIGGFREGFEGSQDWDFVLRFTEKTQNIYHIPKILYHWRMIPSSTAMNALAKNYAHESSYKAIQEALDRRGEGGEVRRIPDLLGNYRVYYPVQGNPLISIIICTKDQPHLLRECLESIFNNTDYYHFEVIVVDNGSTETETLQLLDHWKNREPERFSVLRLDIEFNFSTLNNTAVDHAKGDILLFMNNDTKVIHSNWLSEMVGYALRESIGAVSVKLLFKNNTIQHAGLVVRDNFIKQYAYKMPVTSPGEFCRLLITTNFSVVTAACLMVKKDKFLLAGGFDEEFKVALGDVDLCLKLLDLGLYNVVLQHIHLYHFESQTRGYEDTPEKVKRFKREHEILREKWGALLLSDSFYHKDLEPVTLTVLKPPSVREYIDTQNTIGYFDELKEEEGILIARGWAKNPLTLNKAEEVVVVDQTGSIIAHVNVHEERPDVAAVFKNINLLNCGWRVEIKKQALKKGSHEFKAYSYDRQNEKAYLLKGTFSITV